VGICDNKVVILKTLFFIFFLSHSHTRSMVVRPLKDVWVEIVCKVGVAGMYWRSSRGVSCVYTSVVRDREPKGVNDLFR